MLYKKYHRNFVRQFKKGAEFEHISCIYNTTDQYYCTGELMIELDRCCGGYWILTLISAKSGYKGKFTLVFVDGVIEKVNWINCNKNNHAI